MMDMVTNEARPSVPILGKFSKDACQAYVSGLADLWNTLDVDQMLQVFTEASRVEYIDKDPAIGLAAIRRMLADNFSTIGTYRLRKFARVVDEPEIVTELDIRWTTKSEPDIARHARCFEILRIEDSKLVFWERSPNFRIHDR